MSSRRNTWLAVATWTLAAFALTTGSANADLIFELDTHISSSPEMFSPILPAGDPPWATAAFAALDNSTVQLTMSANLQNPDEFISVWYFNFDPAGFPEDLMFSHQSGVMADDINSSGVPMGDFNQGGGGLFDIRFDFPTSNQADRFQGMETSVYEITGDEPLTPLSPEDFNFFSAPQGGQPLFKSAIHIQGIRFDLPPPSEETIEASAWVGAGNVIPEPSTLILLGLGLGGVALFARKRSSKT